MNIASICSKFPLKFIQKRFSSISAFRNSVNYRKENAKRLVLVENLYKGRNIKSIQMHKEIFSDRFQCQIDNIWSWSFQQRNYFLLMLSSIDDLEKFQNNCSFNLHSFPIRTRMIQTVIDLSKFPLNSGKNVQHFEFNYSSKQKPIDCGYFKRKFTSDELAQYFEGLYTLSELDLNLRYFLITQLEDILCKGVFSDFQIYPFGSSLAGLGDSNSDLDIALLKCPTPPLSDVNQFSQPEVKSERDQVQQSLSLVADIVRFFMPNFSQVNRILRARIPIIKMSFEPAPIQLDISIELSEENGHHGFIMANYMSYCTKHNPKIRQFLIILKLWAKQHGIVKSIPGSWFTNFQIITLALFFLQSKGILLSMERVQSLVSIDSLPETVPVPSIHELLYEFLEFIISFDFEKNALSILENKTFSKPNFSPLYIENPIERDLNICKNINGVEFKKFLLTSYNSLDAMHNKDFHIVDLLNVEYLKKLEREMEN